jgi:hypothetical protein
MKRLHVTTSHDIMALQIRSIIREDHVAIVETERVIPQWFNELGIQQIESDLKI